MSTTLVIADDQPLVRAGLRSLLEGESGVLVVAEAVDGEQAVAEVRRHRPDVVLMDIRMPNMDGLQATRQLMVEETRTRVLVPPSTSTSTSSMRCGPVPAVSC